MNELIRNIPFSEPIDLKEEIDYDPGKVASKTLAQQPNAGMTLFAFDAGEGISTHAAGGDALVYVLDGVGIFTINGVENIVQTGQSIVMPKGIPHSVRADSPMKMLLVVVK